MVFFRILSRLARDNAIFAASEIGKGAVVLTLGDIIVADEVGALISAAAHILAFTPLKRQG